MTLNKITLTTKQNDAQNDILQNDTTIQNDILQNDTIKQKDTQHNYIKRKTTQQINKLQNNTQQNSKKAIMSLLLCVIMLRVVRPNVTGPTLRLKVENLLIQEKKLKVRTFKIVFKHNKIIK